MRKSAWILAASVMLPTLAWAEGGEVVLEPRGGIEATRWGFGSAKAWAVSPAFGVTARYGWLGDSVQSGLGIRYAWTSGVGLDSVTLEGKTGRLYADMSTWALPVSIGYLLSRGGEMEGLFTAYSGLAYTSAGERGLADPARRDSTGRLQQYSVTLETRGSWGWLAGGEVAVQYRPLDWLGGVVALYAEGRRGLGGTDVSFGVVLRPVLVRQVGASF